ncbi:hypothetical protein TARUN_5023 [Trichoderma arundinaceum]|uniref:Uncharacterized protein n=1 Tax=Trichoderma arundinaceum TaxID=490622 RepID=A0A395NMC6_TRIAR|nr:hypothetical protein TARUN_5023 [Trichoderma arundinaceum]
MPATNRGGLPGADYNYLKAQPPSWESVRTGLSIFALFIIARFCVQRIYRWLRPAQRRNTTPPPTNSVLLQRQYQPRLVGPMDDEKSIEGVNDQQEDVRAATAATTTNTTISPMDRHPHWRSAGGALPGPFISRLPPAPPLTPPELSTAVFSLDERSPSSQSFIHQPNPDYMSSTSTTAFQTGSPDSASIPRRRSYTRTLPISVPVSHSPQAQSPEAESVDPTFPPSSYPPSIGLLPPAPPSGLDLELDDHAHRNVDIQGEIISVLDRDGAGWTRHTRVYGGGACLACAASGGGFYGATVTPEEMR